MNARKSQYFFFVWNPNRRRLLRVG